MAQIWTCGCFHSITCSICGCSGKSGHRRPLADAPSCLPLLTISSTSFLNCHHVHLASMISIQHVALSYVESKTQTSYQLYHLKAWSVADYGFFFRQTKSTYSRILRFPRHTQVLVQSFVHGFCLPHVFALFFLKLCAYVCIHACVRYHIIWPASWLAPWSVQGALACSVQTEKHV